MDVSAVIRVCTSKSADRRVWSGRLVRAGRRNVNCLVGDQGSLSYSQATPCLTDKLSLRNSMSLTDLQQCNPKDYVFFTGLAFYDRLQALLRLSFDLATANAAVEKDKRGERRQKCTREFVHFLNEADKCILTNPIRTVLEYAGITIN
ncbi:unnamed protein product [Protopolystoma xenopodis]|uniref:Uncharacterized protein n=1 Tax=Protopolystoma xenopodis TaxID=117903 RepID=A0A448WLT7_9PLAT|nr:unnamed protein product [Protopolystoma xenopodis]